MPAEEIAERFASELGHVTPKVGADSTVFDDDGRLLVLRHGE